MNFNSFEYMVFLPAVALCYALAFGSNRGRHTVLLAASYFFYMSWNWQYAGLILTSTVIDYVIAIRLERSQADRTRRLLLGCSLLLNLGLLAFFKYHNFFVDSVGGLASVTNLPFDSTVWQHSFLLPVGISFYTFQTLSYSIDVYRRAIPAERSFVKFALFVSFFPQLVAGPIVRASDFLPQLQVRPAITNSDVLTGASLIFRGLIKKVLIADLLAGLGVDSVFANPSAYSSVTLLLALYGYAFQIYNDFSGYSDIAIGSARVLGYRLPDNFNRPYLARNVREFWTRWHISLSTWLRDYLYIPLGGNRGPRRRVYRNLLITMLLGGLWHGAAWHFVAWGGWHGILLILARGSSREHARANPVRAWFQRAGTFHLIVAGWLLFRVESLSHLTSYVSGLFALSGGLQLSGLYVVVLTCAACVHFSPKVAWDRVQLRFADLPIVVQAPVYACLILVFAGLSFGAPEFIYFQF